MNLIKDWQEIKTHFDKSFKRNFHICIASVDENGNPTITPIGTLFLNSNQTGFYFEKFPAKLPMHAKVNKKICLLSVNSGRLMWLKALFLMKFTNYPAIKLYGELGEKRKASEKEIYRLNRRMRITKGLKGNSYLWKNMEFIREVKFTKADKINLGKMTSEL